MQTNPLSADNFNEFPNGFDFTAQNGREASPDIVDAELDLLEVVRFTETFSELDTLTVTTDFVRDPDQFLNLCSRISSGSFLRIAPRISLVDEQTGRLSNEFPFYFNTERFNSLAMWLIMFIERSIWVNYLTFVSMTVQRRLPEIKCVWLQPESKLILFKNEILPYCQELCQKMAKEPSVTSQALCQELEQKVKSELPTSEGVSQFNGGLPQQNTITSFDVATCLHQFKQKVSQHCQLVKPNEQIVFFQFI